MSSVISESQLKQVKKDIKEWLEPEETKITRAKHVESDICNNMVGNALSELSDMDDNEVEVEHWSGTTQKVWKITRK